MKHFCALVLLLSAAMFPSESRAWDLWPFGDDGIEFEIQIKGLESAPVDEERLEELAEQAIDPENPPKDLTGLNVLGGLMSERILKAMHARAFYDAEVAHDVVPSASEDELPTVAFEVFSGQRYLVGQSRITKQQGEETVSITSPNLTALMFAEDSYAMSQAILNSGDAIQQALADKQCYLSLSVKPLVVLDKLEGTASVNYQVKHGPEANFGEVTFEGDSAVSEDILAKFIKWKQGRCFDQQKVTNTQTALLQSQLLASAEITHAAQPNAQGQVPMTIKLTDRPHRTITAGTNFATDEGVGVKFGWEHRNLLGRAHKFTSNATISQLEYGVDGQYSIPYFYHDNQKLTISGGIAQESTDSFDSTSASFLVAVDRKLSKYLLVGVGGGMRLSQITEEGDQTENFGLLYIPVYTQWDSRDNSLDPTKGIYARASIAPYSDFTGQGVSFLKAEGTAQTYLTAKTWMWKPTLALRGAYGQINGAGTSDIPADLRFFAGGGGSVRGYNYRAIGPRDNGEAEGGTVWTELSAEARFRFTEEFGAVAFLDAGNTYAASRPDFTEELLFGAGVGARYFSPIGPLRFDVGIPLDDVEDDTAFGVYISIGQSF